MSPRARKPSCHPGPLARGFGVFANSVAHASGHPATFVLCCLIIVAWAVTGPVFGYSDTWQLIINTSTTIITFLMVFLIQNTQNRDGAAVQVKLDELLRAVRQADNGFVGIEKLTEEEVEALRDSCERRAAAKPARPRKRRRRPARISRAH
ncbi:MAG: low affinity iron permease family protein [Alphaproteobacteria bacterium]|nr:low affinity iron permease family protein [Alphaproteobacteria bacterium]